MLLQNINTHHVRETDVGLKFLKHQCKENKTHKSTSSDIINTLLMLDHEIKAG